MRLFFLSTIVVVPGLLACTNMNLHRTEASGYGDEYSTKTMGVKDFYRERKKQMWMQAKGELGIRSTASLPENINRAIYTRAVLNRMEKRIPNTQLKKQYYGMKPYLRNDAERVYFLRLPTKEARDRWAASRGIKERQTKFDSMTSNLINKGDIAKGMSREAVEQSWGEPKFRESAGDPIYGNERWKYTKVVPSEDGYKNESRVIYFEAGRVVGWETRN